MGVEKCRFGSRRNDFCTRSDQFNQLCMVSVAKFLAHLPSSGSWGCKRRGPEVKLRGYGEGWDGKRMQHMGCVASKECTDCLT